MNINKTQVTTIAVGLLLMVSCTSVDHKIGKYATIDASEERKLRDSFWEQTRLPVPEAYQSDNQPIVEAEQQLFSFVANDLSVEEAAKLFGRMNNLNIVVEEGVKGQVTVDLKDLPFTDIMESILSAHGYYWERRDNIVYVRSWQTRTFTVDYVRLIRKGEGISQAKVSSSVSQSGAGGGDDTAGSVYIENKDEVDFWSELESQLNTMKTEAGRIIVNRLAGTVQVSDVHKHVNDIATYIQHINDAIHRQVDIEVKIVEVILNEDNSLGIDWSRLIVNNDGNSLSGNISTIVTNPAGGITALPATIDLNFSSLDNGVNEISAILQALNEQGDVRVVSQPHIRSLNNQSALIKVGTDRTFFRREQSTDSTSAGFQTTFTDVPEVVTEGVVLSITPQISASGWITMDVSPVVTRVSSISEAFDINGVLSSTAPNLDISQISTLVRARNGETVVIGGLIQNQQFETVRKVPGLGHLPILGKLFTANYTSDVKTELIMLMTPRLVAR